MSKVLIMDYSNCYAEVVRIPETVADDKIADYLFNTLGYKESQISWMSSDNDIPVFEQGEDCPIITL